MPDISIQISRRLHGEKWAYVLRSPYGYQLRLGDFVGFLEW